MNVEALELKRGACRYTSKKVVFELVQLWRMTIWQTRSWCIVHPSLVITANGGTERSGHARTSATSAASNVRSNTDLRAPVPTIETSHVEAGNDPLQPALEPVRKFISHPPHLRLQRVAGNADDQTGEDYRVDGSVEAVERKDFEQFRKWSRCEWNNRLGPLFRE